MRRSQTYKRVVERHLDYWVGADPPIGSVARPDDEVAAFGGRRGEAVFRDAWRSEKL